MPITKKKGAIFAIHADTPVKVGHSSASYSCEAATSASPIKKGTTTIKRRALTVKQNIQPRAFPSDQVPYLKDGQPSKLNILSDDLVKPILKPKTDSIRSTRQPLTEKKHRRVDSPVSDAPTKNTTIRTPAKKARVFDRSKNDFVVTPAGKSCAANGDIDDGSPASRTRSKTKSRPTASPRTRQPLVSPVTVAMSKSTIRQHPSALSGSSLTTRKSAISVFEDTSNIENIPIPVNKQVLNPKRGKDIVDLLERAGSNGPDENDMEEYERAYDENIRSVRKGREVRTAQSVIISPKSKGKGRAVKGDGPLADVSEAYGASGSEPMGFREQKMCKLHTA